MKESWQTLSEEEIDKNRWWAHLRRQFRRPDGKEGSYDLVEKNHAVLVVARADDGRFLMIREYKYLLDEVGVAVPAGGIEPGEEPIDGAVREFREETGYEAATWLPIGKCAGMPFLTNEWLYVFYATDLKQVAEHDDEVVETLWMTKEEIDDAIRQGSMWDSHVISAWCMAKLHLGL